MVIDSSPLLLHSSQGDGTKPSIQKVRSPGNQPPSLDVFQKSLINITKALITENYKGLGSSVPGMEMKIKYVFLIINHNVIPPLRASQGHCSHKSMLLHQSSFLATFP